VNLTTHETLLAVKRFEAVLADFGAVVQEYRTDQGGAFVSAAFKAKLQEFRQIQSFAGVGAHYQSAAERAIQTIMSMARTCMLHHAIHWPEVSDASLWPLSVRYCAFIHNHVPDIGTGLSPHDLLSRTRWPVTGLHNLQVWGAPTYVLDKKMQDGHKLPRWKPRSRRVMFVGLSDRHASLLPLVLDLATKSITAQFHVLFDGRFSTISVPDDVEVDPTRPPWSNLFGDSIFQYVFDPADPTEHNLDPLSADTASSEADAHASRRLDIADAYETVYPASPLAVRPLAVLPWQRICTRVVLFVYPVVFLLQILPPSDPPQ